MKKYLLFLFATLTSVITAQVPQSLSHRGTVYNTNGSLVANTQVKIRASILDNSAVVYSENFTVTTTSSGQYNINLGTSTSLNSPNITFDTINWGTTTTKELKIEIDPTGVGSTYPIVGQNQLNSVPYALYASTAKNMSNGAEIVSTMAELRNYVPVDNKLLYIKGYWNEGDGGEGFFIYKAAGKMYNESSVPADNNGTVIASTNSAVQGRWFRQYSGYLNALYFGVIKDIGPSNIPGTFSNSDRINQAITFASENLLYNKRSSDMTLFFPNGTYFIDKQLVLKSDIKLLGGKGTLFVANASSTYDYMFKLAEGPVKLLNMENFTLDLQNRTNVGGFLLEGIKDSGGTGGLWTSSFKNIRINHAKGTGIWIKGGENVGGTGNSDYELPNQYLIFENIWITRESQSANCLKITGQLNTTTFLNCNFEVPYAVDGPGLAGTNVSISSLTTNVNSAEVSFINCATGGGVTFGYQIKNAHNVTFDTCWFEDIALSIDLLNCTGIKVANCRFANAAGRGSNATKLLPAGTGRCISVENSSVDIENNYVTVTSVASANFNKDRFVTGLGTNGGNNVINLHNNSFQDIQLSETIGTVQYVPISTINTYVSSPPSASTLSGIGTGGKKLVFVQVSTANNGNGLQQIYRINSTIGAGETIFIRADQNTITFYPMSPSGELGGKNIVLNGRTSLTLTNGQGATFIKLDGVNGNEKCAYQLVSISN